MKWIELSIETSNEAIEAVSNILIEAGSAGVSIENSPDMLSAPASDHQSDSIWAIDETDYSDKNLRISAYFSKAAFLPELLPVIEQRVLQLEEFGLAIEPNRVMVKEVKEEDWATAWKKYYHPVRVTRFLTIVPSWESYTPMIKEERLIRLDPGLAFGTGTHPTTQLSLQALEMVMRGNETVLDIGTGSGVLSIASKALGAGKVFAYDIDQVAVASARDNVQLNHYAKDVRVSSNHLLEGIDHKANIIVANILAEIIEKLIPDAWRLLHEGGLFVTSGIIESKNERLQEQLIQQGFDVLEILQLKDWFTIISQKPEEGS